MHPRWEDYDYERADPVENQLHWLGDGQTVNEKTLTGDSTCYTDLPLLGESNGIPPRGMVPPRAVSRCAAE